MTKNRSPWINQLDTSRQTAVLNQDEQTDTAIIGAGIAGVSTAFFFLKYSKERVIIVEGGKLAHGATGHNAGYVATYFERPFSDIVKEFGLEKACEGQRNVEEAWALLDTMYTEAGLSIAFSRFKGYTGLSTEAKVLEHLENNWFKRKGGLRPEEMYIVEDAPFLHSIPEKYAGLYEIVPREEVHLRLETFDPQYVAMLAGQKGVLNSALFCQEVIRYLLEEYADRFSLYEHSPVHKVVLKDDLVLLDVIKHTITCQRVVLCTNGFENFEIIAPTGLAIDTRFHHNVNGVVAFMSGYLEVPKDLPAAMSYFPKEDSELTDNPGDPYFYISRRPYEYEGSSLPSNKYSLVCIGGPDFSLEDRGYYNRDLDFPESAQEQINTFVKRTYDKSEQLNYVFMWHGLMGYTSNMLRMVGKDPEHPRLFYNLGCNGLGILPSVFGGDRVARTISGEKFPPSIFDVPTRVGRQG